MSLSILDRLTPDSNLERTWVSNPVALQLRADAPLHMPEGEHPNLTSTRCEAVVEEVANLQEEDPSDARDGSRPCPDPGSGLRRKQAKRTLHLLEDRVGRSRPVGSPPPIRFLNVLGGPGGDDDRELRLCHRRSRSSRSAARTVSPRSASAIDSSSSRSSSGDTSNVSVSSSAITVTCAPSGRLTPSSGTMAPARTRAEKTFTLIVYSSGPQGSRGVVRAGPIREP
jgi:hypothetical protein